MPKKELYKGLGRAKHDMTTACRQQKAEEEHIKASVDTVFCLTQ
jgi:hypothetical protein